MRSIRGRMPQRMRSPRRSRNLAQRKQKPDTSRADIVYCGKIDNKILDAP